MKLRSLDDTGHDVLLLCLYLGKFDLFFFDLVTHLSGYLAGKNVNVSEFDGSVLRDFERFYAAPVLQPDSHQLFMLFYLK